jgi:hypothetical protein
VQLLDGLDPASARTRYCALVSAAFCLAAEERFPGGPAAAEIIDHAADVRSRSDRTAAISANDPGLLGEARESADRMLTGMAGQAPDKTARVTPEL